jgi:hypothetical protein
MVFSLIIMVLARFFFSVDKKKRVPGEKFRPVGLTVSILADTANESLPQSGIFSGNGF